MPRSNRTAGAALAEARRVERALARGRGPRVNARARASRAALLVCLARGKAAAARVEQALALLRLEPDEQERSAAYDAIEESAARLGASAAGVEAWLALATDAWAHGRRPRAEAAADRALSIAQALGHPRLVARAHIEHARFAFGRSDWADARAHTEAARTLAAGREVDLEIVAQMGLAAIGSHELAADAARHARRAVLLAEELGDRALLARARAQLGIVLVERGVHDEGRAVLEAAVAIERERRDAESECRGLLYLAMLELDAGRPLAALRLLARARESVEAGGTRVARGMVHGSIGVVHLVRGHAAAAARELSRAELLLEDLGNRHARITFTAFLGAAEALAGRRAEARGAFEQAHVLLGDGGGPPYGRALVLVLEAVARIAERGDREAARQVLCEVEAGGVLEHWADLRVGCRLLRRAIVGEERGAHAPAEASAGLVVGAEGRWFSLEGARPTDLAARPVLRRLLWVLATARASAPGVVRAREELARALWPEDVRLAPRLLANRVNVAVATLRRVGLRDAICTGPGGYHLRADVPITFDPPLS